MKQKWIAPLFCGALASAATSSLALAQVDFNDRVNEAFGLRASTIEMLDLGVEPGTPFVALVPIDGVEYVLSMWPDSVRSAQYRLLVANESGHVQPAAPGIDREYRGELLDVPTSSAAGSIVDDGLVARIFLPDGSSWWIEPIFDRIDGAEIGMHVIYNQDDVIESGGLCAAGEAMRIGALGAEGEGGATDGISVAELACDADYEFYLRYGSSVPNVESRINTVINVVNQQYERDVQITHQITTIIVRSSSNDPYTSSDAETLLNQFRNHWNANQGGIQRDLAQLFTGRSLNGGTIGIAWIGAVCTNYGYSVVESDCCGSTGCATDLSAHELGHNWNADHCSCNGWTMNPFLTCSNRFHSTYDIPEINAFRNSRPCLDDGGSAPTDAPLVGYSLSYGTLLTGDLGSLDESDGDYLGIDAVQYSGNKHRTQLIARPDSPFLTVSQLDLSIEVRTVTTGVNAKVYLRNWDTNRWVQIDTFSVSTTDMVRNYSDISNANAYIHNTSGHVYVRIYAKKTDGDFNFYVDEVEATVYE